MVLQTVEGVITDDFTCKHCGQTLGKVVKAGNVKVLRLEGAAFIVAIRKTTDLRCKMCDQVTTWYRGEDAK